MKITPFQKSIGVITALGLAYLACDYRGFGEDPKQPLSGRIQLDGRPLPKGTIRFVSIDSQQLKGAGGYIVDGDYVVPSEFGLPPGKYQVQVSSIRSDEVANSLAAQRDGAEAVQLEEKVPDRYNTKSEIILDLTDGGVLGVDFDLK